jgi:hypothetical protein
MATAHQPMTRMSVPKRFLTAFALCAGIALGAIGRREVRTAPDENADDLGNRTAQCRCWDHPRHSTSAGGPRHRNGPTHPPSRGPPRRPALPTR